MERPSLPAQQQGVLLLRAGRIAEAEPCFRAALRDQPLVAELHATLGAILATLGQRAEAAECFAAALRLKPDSADAHGNLGNLLREIGRADEAEHHLRTALRLRPAYPEAWNNLGALLRAQGRHAEAEGCFRAALRLRPNLLAALTNLGDVLRDQGRMEDAAQAFRVALRLQPDAAPLWAKLGQLQHDAGQPAEAASSFRAALLHQPDNADALLGLGVVQATRNPGEARGYLQTALRLRPDLPETWNSLGDVLRCLGEHGEAERHFREALRLRPDYAEARANLGMLLLRQGQFETGWALYEARWAAHPWRQARRHFDAPLWRGEALAGRTLLVHAEQGFGDSLQFCRYLALLEPAARLVLEVPAPLVALLAHGLPFAQVVRRGDALPPFDVHCPMLSLPFVFGTTLATVPATTPYLSAEPARRAAWRARLATLPGLRVGLVWAGRPQMDADARRSLALAELAPLAATKDVSFVSLQTGPASAQAVPQGMALFDPAAELRDFADTAALVAELDLVIGVDTAVIHLAGALGRPVWLLNRFDTCWRWLQDRPDSPWYPTLRQFRQAEPGGWAAVITSVAAALAAAQALPRTP